MTMSLVLAVILTATQACNTSTETTVVEIFIQKGRCKTRLISRTLACACYLLSKNGLLTSFQENLCKRLFGPNLDALKSHCRGRKGELKKVLKRLSKIALKCFQAFPTPSPSPESEDLTEERNVALFAGNIAKGVGIDAHGMVGNAESVLRRFGDGLPDRLQEGLEKCLKCFTCLKIGNCMVGEK